MDRKIAFIGSGNMGSAIIKGALRVIAPSRVIITGSNFERTKILAQELGVSGQESNVTAAEIADIVMLCVKPQALPAVAAEIAPVLRASEEVGHPKLLVSIAAGVSVAGIREIVGCATYPVVRLMPNTPALVGKGLILMSCDEQTAKEDAEELGLILSGCGTVREIPENLIDKATAISGCSPAFVYMFIEALADSGVMTGLSRKDALEFAAHAVMGAGAMVLETGEHPGLLKDKVCSPGGSTIAGVAMLEEKGLRGAVIAAANAAYNAVVS